MTMWHWLMAIAGAAIGTLLITGFIAMIIWFAVWYVPKDRK